MSGETGTGGGNGRVIRGTLYDEEIMNCPLCKDQLMWYFCPADKEILSCPNPECAYPCDADSEYVIRSRDHGKKCIEGVYLEIEKEEAQEKETRDNLIKIDEDLSFEGRAAIVTKNLETLKQLVQPHESFSMSEEATLDMDFVNNVLKGLEEIDHQNVD